MRLVPQEQGMGGNLWVGGVEFKGRVGMGGGRRAKTSLSHPNPALTHYLSSIQPDLQPWLQLPLINKRRAPWPRSYSPKYLTSR